MVYLVLGYLQSTQSCCPFARPHHQAIGPVAVRDSYNYPTRMWTSLTARSIECSASLWDTGVRGSEDAQALGRVARVRVAARCACCHRGFIFGSCFGLWRGVARCSGCGRGVATYLRGSRSRGCSGTTAGGEARRPSGVRVLWACGSICMRSLACTCRWVFIFMAMHSSGVRTCGRRSGVASNQWLFVATCVSLCLLAVWGMRVRYSVTIWSHQDSIPL